MKWFPYLTLPIAALAVAIHAVPGVTEALQFDRDALSRAEIWRLVTGHFTHFGADHLRWDVIAFVAFGSLAEIRSRYAWFGCLVIGAVGISAGIACFQPQFACYRGLSGLDSALFAFVTTDLLRDGWRSRDKLTAGFAAIALAGFVAKSLYETITGLTLFVAASADFKAVPLAHLLGAVVGAGLAFTIRPTEVATASHSRVSKRKSESAVIRPSDPCTRKLSEIDV